MPPRLLLSLCLLFLLVGERAQAQVPRILAEGRLAAPVPGSDASRIYERRRIKRTVPMGDAQPLAETWDALLVDGEGALKTLYCDWDENFLYLAAEMSEPGEVRFDIDGAGDGWFRGADNLSVRVTPPVAGSTTPLIEARRFDTVQNKERPVWAASPIPPSAVLSSWSRTDSGVAVRIAIPRTEAISLRRRPGAEFGVSVEAGKGAAAEGDTRAVSIKTFLRVLLADTIEATAAGLTARVFVLGGNQLTPAQPLRATLEVKNDTRTTARLRRLTLGGSLGSGGALEPLAFRDILLKPGDRWRRELKTSLRNELEVGSFVLRGAVERDDGGVIAALATFDRIDPYEITLKLDDRPVDIKDPESARRRQLVVSVRSRTEAKNAAAITLGLPAGWTVEAGAMTRTVSLSFATEVRGVSFRVIVPADAAAGEYALQATVVVGRQTYLSSAVLRVVGS